MQDMTWSDLDNVGIFMANFYEFIQFLPVHFQFKHLNQIR